MSWWGRPVRRCWARQRGVGLLEIVLAIAVVGTLATAVLSALSTSARAVVQVDTEVTAQDLARTQMEYTKAYTPYLTPPATYPTVTAPQDYSVTAAAQTVSGRGPDIERIVVTVSRGSAVELTVEGYKSNR